jgi:hypothetical protein
MSRGWLPTLAAVLAGLLAVSGIVTAGRAARAALEGHEAFSPRFTAVECASPPGLSRVEFLEEVQYLARSPDRVRLLDPRLPAELAAAFARHPWVEEVKRVEVLPGRRVRVELVHRRPVLAVCLPHPVAAGQERPCRAVDGSGILLPAGAPAAGLPVLEGVPRGPAGPPGTSWGDARVVDAVGLAAFLAPHRERLGLSDTTWEVVESDLVIRRARLRIIWGRPPAREAAGEAPAAVKLARLLDLATGHGLTGPEVDLRPSGGQPHAAAHP